VASVPSIEVADRRIRNRFAMCRFCFSLLILLPSILFGHAADERSHQVITLSVDASGANIRYDLYCDSKLGRTLMMALKMSERQPDVDEDLLSPTLSALLEKRPWIEVSCGDILAHLERIGALNTMPSGNGALSTIPSENIDASRVQSENINSNRMPSENIDSNRIPSGNGASNRGPSGQGTSYVQRHLEAFWQVGQTPLLRHHLFREESQADLTSTCKVELEKIPPGRVLGSYRPRTGSDGSPGAEHLLLTYHYRLNWPGHLPRDRGITLTVDTILKVFTSNSIFQTSQTNQGNLIADRLVLDQETIEPEDFLGLPPSNQFKLRRALYFYREVEALPRVTPSSGAIR